jgi:hypothetical protein
MLIEKKIERHIGTFFGPQFLKAFSFLAEITKTKTKNEKFLPNKKYISSKLTVKLNLKKSYKLYKPGCCLRFNFTSIVVVLNSKGCLVVAVNWWDLEHPRATRHCD